MITAKEIALSYVVHGYEYKVRLLITLNSDTARCKLKCIKNEDMVLNLGEAPVILCSILVHKCADIHLYLYPYFDIMLSHSNIHRQPRK